jgi:hypothetical protein
VRQNIMAAIPRRLSRRGSRPVAGGRICDPTARAPSRCPATSGPCGIQDQTIPFRWMVTTMAAGAGQFVGQPPTCTHRVLGLGSCSVSSSLRLSHDECRDAKADRSSQTDCQQREPRLDIEPHLGTLLKALGVKVGQYLTCGSKEGVRGASSTILP